MELGEAIETFFGLDPADDTRPGDLSIVLCERDSGEAIEGVTVKIEGPTATEAVTDASGSAEFRGVPPGVYTVWLRQDGFSMTPDNLVVSVAPGAVTTLDPRVERVILAVTIKRLHIKGLWDFKGAVKGTKKANMDYGHWWTEVDGLESYGWWPAALVGPWDTVWGVPGVLNALAMPHYGGTATLDPHHGDTADEEFCPRVMSGKPAASIKAEIRAFAWSFRGAWEWPLGPNCHTFQEDLMQHCKLTANGALILR